MKKTVCYNCADKEKRLAHTRTGTIIEISVCKSNGLETKRFKNCPCGYTEELIQSLVETGEKADEIRYIEEETANRKHLAEYGTLVF